MKQVLLCVLFLLAGICTLEGAAKEWMYHFEKGSTSTLPKELYQNKASVFKPYGKAQIISASCGKLKKAVRLRSAGKSVDLVTTRAFPVRMGDTFSVTVTFRSPDGKSSARIGMYGDYQAQEFKPINTDWDTRQATFEVKNPKTKSVRFFIAAKKGESVDYAHFTVRSLGQQKDKQFTPGKMRALWFERTRGTNYALGKKVKFMPESNYYLTVKGGTDSTDLTDGKLGPANDMLWFDRKAVAFFRALHGVTMIIDLGQIRSLGRTVIRINGGRPGWFPKILEAYVSKDGKNFYPTHILHKTGETESNVADWKDLYYLPEKSSSPFPCYVYPFELELNADARFVAVRAPIYNSIMMITDEWAVMKAKDSARKEPSYNAAYKKAPVLLNHESVILRTRLAKMYMDREMALPQFLYLDSRVKGKVNKFHYTMDFPKEVTFHQETSWPAFCRNLVKTERKGNRVIYTFDPKVNYENFIKWTKQFGMPFFFSLDNKKIPKGESHVIFTTFINDKKMFTHRSELEVLDIPRVPPFKRLNVGLAWTENRHAATYPDYVATQRKLGFNTLSLFPISLYFNEKNVAPRFKAMMEKAVKEGFFIRQQMSPSALMRAYNRKDTQMHCTSSKDTSRVCPSYRGEHYKKMLEWIRNSVRDYPAHYVTFDEEQWFATTLKTAMKCERCNALRLKKKMQWAQFLNWAQADFIGPFREMVRQGAAAAGRKAPLVGFYGTMPAGVKNYENIRSLSCGRVEFLGISILLKKGQVDELQDSYYGRSSLEASKRARALYEYAKTPARISSWITGGTGAHRETPYPERTGQHLLETLMNGAGGIQYYFYPSFESPLDYYYHARAMKMIAPREDILMDGTLDSVFTGSNKTLRYTKRDLGKTSLILIGNYEKRSSAKTVLKLGKVRSVLELSSNKKIPVRNGKLTVTVPADDFVLLEVKR